MDSPFCYYYPLFYPDVLSSSIAAAAGVIGLESDDNVAVSKVVGFVLPPPMDRRKRERERERETGREGERERDELGM